ncbi:MAG TPA: hypothetical protein VFE91_04350 [Nitrososphaerales archaeon]|nr:hypothetical protein [Nitrososphaerales archaeon]
MLKVTVPDGANPPEAEVSVTVAVSVVMVPTGTGDFPDEILVEVEC